MTYLQRNNPGRRGADRRRRLAAIAVPIALIAIAVIFFAPHFFPAFFTSIARPFWRAEFSVESGSLRSPEQLLRENEDLKRQLAEGTVRLASTRATEAENAELKALLGRASTTPYILAAVLVRPPVAAYDMLVIDAGADHAFATTSLVYAPGNVLIGRITDVLSETSKVTLFSSPGQKFDVLIGSAHAPAVAIGRGGGQYEAQVPRGSHIAEGDAVIASSLNNKPFGIVSSVISDPAQTFETVLFAPPINLYQLRWALVQK